MDQYRSKGDLMHERKKDSLLITGATGLLGNTLVPYLQNSGYHIITHGRTSEAEILFDLSNSAETYKVLS